MNKSLELQAYQITSAVVLLVERFKSEAEHEAAQARHQIKAYSDGLETIKKTNLPTMLDPTGLGKQIALGEIQMLINRAIGRGRVANDRLAVCVSGLAAARKAQSDAHAVLVKGNITIVSRGRKSVQVTIRVGDQSVTRHLTPSRQGYSGWAWDKAAIMEFPRDWVDPVIDRLLYVDTLSVAA